MTSNTIGVQIYTIIALTASIIGLNFYDITYVELLLILLGYFLYGCLGIVITFHRQLTHNSFEFHKIFNRIFSTLGCFAGTGSPIAWVAIHLNHHLQSDKETDPHSPHHKGLKIFLLDYGTGLDRNTKWRMRGLITDKFQQFLHRYYFLILGTYSFILFLIGGFYLMLFLHLMPSVITALMSNVVNFVGHKPKWLGSYRSHNINDLSANNWVWAIPSWGESWHNNHHRFPKKSYFGIKWWEIDIAGLIINFLKLKK